MEKNGEAKELICVTHGHELRGGGMLVGWGVQGNKEEKKCDNGNSIINKMNLKKKNQTNKKNFFK